METMSIKNIINKQSNKTINLDVKLAKSGDKQAYVRLMRANKNNMYRIAKSILTIEEDLRITTLLFYFEDMKYKDIAKTLGIREGTVKSRLSRAKHKLYVTLGEENNNE